MSFVLSPVCGPMPNGHRMACFYSAILLTSVAGVLFLLSLLAQLRPGRKLLVAFDGLTLLSLFTVYLIYHRHLVVTYAGDKAFGLCKMNEMACHHSFGYSEWILLAVLFFGLFHLVSLVLLKEKA